MENLQQHFQYIPCLRCFGSLQFVALKVNTNQYGRTFEDRSYVFAIKALPTTDVASDDTADTPYVPGALITSKIASGSGLLYNIGVRGKRGNIVQTYPAVEVC
jgi:hypothetical protein